MILVIEKTRKQKDFNKKKSNFNILITIKLKKISNKKEPVAGIEPATSCLLGKCSTTKLYRLPNFLTLFFIL